MIIDKKSFYTEKVPENKNSLPIEARTDSNEVKSYPKVIPKNKKKFFTNCFGCKIYYE